MPRYKQGHMKLRIWWCRCKQAHKNIRIRGCENTNKSNISSTSVTSRLHVGYYNLLQTSLHTLYVYISNGIYLIILNNNYEFFNLRTTKFHFLKYKKHFFLDNIRNLKRIFLGKNINFFQGKNLRQRPESIRKTFFKKICESF